MQRFKKGSGLNEIALSHTIPPPRSEISGNSRNSKKRGTYGNSSPSPVALNAVQDDMPVNRSCSLCNASRPFPAILTLGDCF